MMTNILLLWITLCAIKEHMHDACTPFMFLFSALHSLVLVIILSLLVDK